MAPLSPRNAYSLHNTLCLFAREHVERERERESTALNWKDIKVAAAWRINTAYIIMLIGQKLDDHGFGSNINYISGRPDDVL